jgi:hypothetical protein
VHWERRKRNQADCSGEWTEQVPRCRLLCVRVEGGGEGLGRVIKCFSQRACWPSAEATRRLQRGCWMCARVADCNHTRQRRPGLHCYLLLSYTRSHPCIATHGLQQQQPAIGRVPKPPEAGLGWYDRRKVVTGTPGCVPTGSPGCDGNSKTPCGQGGQGPASPFPTLLLQQAAPCSPLWRQTQPGGQMRLQHVACKTCYRSAVMVLP